MGKVTGRIIVKKILCIIIFLTFLLNFAASVKASEDQPNCPGRYLTLINPVRGRDLWPDKNLNHLINQYEIIKANNFPATWLIQYDVLADKELLGEIKSFDGQQEKGVFLEVSKNFSERAKVIYSDDKPWYDPGNVFLSGYSQSERKRLIDLLFHDFKKEFGFYPKSVGAWWIDSYSLGYLRKKYNIRSALIVADQRTTDNYGIWGKWWGVPYYPSKANILTPASSLANKQDVVILQWAQRHPSLGFGGGYKSSYSLQANDYTLLDRNDDFFRELVNVYLDCKNPVGQITIGIETGMESVKFIGQYQRQLEYLNSRSGIKALTLEQFAKVFAGVYQDFPKRSSITDKDSTWVMDTGKRVNKKFNETIIYDQNKSFSDYFLPDKSKFLNRSLTNATTKQSDDLNSLVLAVILLTLFFYIKLRLFRLWVSFALFLFASFGLLLKSFYLYGYKVFFGPVIGNLVSAKIIVIVVSLVIFWLIWKKFYKKYGGLLLLLPLSFAIDPILNSLRGSFISGKFYIGFATDALHFTGITFSKPFSLNFVNLDFPSYLAAGLLKLDLNKIWDDLFLSLFVYPIIHLLAGFVIVVLLKKLPKKLKVFAIAVLSLLLVIHLKNIIDADPRVVSLIK